MNSKYDNKFKELKSVSLGKSESVIRKLHMRSERQPRR